VKEDAKACYTLTVLKKRAGDKSGDSFVGGVANGCNARRPEGATDNLRMRRTQKLREETENIHAVRHWPRRKTIPNNQKKSKSGPALHQRTLSNALLNALLECLITAREDSHLLAVDVQGMLAERGGPRKKRESQFRSS